MDDDIRNLLPKDKFDLDNARAIVNLGYPTVAPILPDLFKWLQDINWPVAHVIAPFLSTIGRPVIPEVRHILNTDDGIWKLWVLGHVVNDLPIEAIADLHDELLRIVTNPTEDEIVEEVVAKVEEILSRL
jgi:uncharacterized protein DUF5071